MFEAEKSFEGVKGWSHTYKEDLVPIQNPFRGVDEWKNGSCKDERRIGSKRGLLSKKRENLKQSICRSTSIPPFKRDWCDFSYLLFEGGTKKAQSCTATYPLKA